MHERMEFPWTVGEASTFQEDPEGTMYAMVEALKDARGYLQIAVEYNGKIGNTDGFKESIERINEALKKAGVEC